jgi:hypothetical protein
VLFFTLLGLLLLFVAVDNASTVIDADVSGVVVGDIGIYVVGLKVH